jgi:hypothetical protein
MGVHSGMDFGLVDTAHEIDPFPHIEMFHAFGPAPRRILPFG